MTAPTLILHAPNINNGGGLVLLTGLLEKVQFPCILLSDARLNLQKYAKSNLQILPFQASLTGRFRAEIQLRKLMLENKDAKVLCLGNLPPLLPVPRRAFLFFQNTLLLSSTGFTRYHLALKCKLLVEKWWLRSRISSIAKVYVQSAEVQQKFALDFPKSVVKILPFADFAKIPSQPADKLADFIFVSAADAHKNHANLFKAWKILGKENMFPRLALTLSSSSTSKLEEIKKLKESGLQVTNYPDLSRSDVQKLMQQCGALIYPSFTESLGLPLLEAKNLGLPVLASELDYVREIVTPAQSFDPSSAKSIARAVGRFLGKPIEARQEIASPQEFLDDVVTS